MSAIIICRTAEGVTASSATVSLVDAPSTGTAATDQPYRPDPGAVTASLSFVGAFDAPADDGGLFGPQVTVPADAPALDRLLGATGRRPDWGP